MYNIESVYLIVSLHDDFYRKSATAMWEFVETHLNNNIKVNRDSSVYVGDMAGRKCDYAYTDLMFSMNLGVPFMVPEVFYGDATGKLASNQTPKLIKDLEKNDKIFNARKYLEDDKEITKNHKTNYETVKMIKKYLENNENDTEIDNKNEKILILYVGSPASGKSHFLTNYLPDFKKKIKYMSQDTFNGTPAKVIKTISQYMDTSSDTSIGNIIVIDNTNGTIKTREKYISLAHNKGYKVMVIYFDTPKEICMHLNALRTKINNIYTELKTIPRSNKNKNKDDKDKDDEDYNNVDVKDDNVKDDIVKDNNKTDSDGNSNVPAVAIHTYWKKLEKPNKIDEHIDELFTIHFETIFPEIETENGITKERFGLLL
jgi:bifunctional polynucleotide phosphatase/kinase